MSEINPEDEVADELQLPESSVQVLIEPATPTKKEREYDDGDKRHEGLIEEGVDEEDEKENMEPQADEHDGEEKSQTEQQNENNNEDGGGKGEENEHQTREENAPDGETIDHGEGGANVSDKNTKDSLHQPDAEEKMKESGQTIGDGETDQISGNNVEDKKEEVEVEQVSVNKEPSADTSDSQQKSERENQSNDVAETPSERDNEDSETLQDVSNDKETTSEKGAEGEKEESGASERENEPEVKFQVTTDIITETMEGEKKKQEYSEGPVGERERTVKTPESIAASVDLPNNLASGHFRSTNRPVTAESEFVYNEHDFSTPDYDMYGPSPNDVDGDKAKRQFSPSKRERSIVSRGESTKSVTFADGVSRGSEKGEDEQSQVTEKAGEDEEKEGNGKEEGTEEQEQENAIDAEEQKIESEEATDIFPTAVSEEKIEEAKKKQQEGLTHKEGLAIELFGASKFEPESMEDVVTKKAYQHFEAGCQLVDRTDFGAAVICFDKALNLLPKEVKFYLMRGEAYLQLCDFQSAILNLKKACVLQPTNDEYYARLAFVYYFQGQSLFDQCLFPEALESFSRAAEMRPEVVSYHTRSIACLAALHRHGECLALVNRRLETEKTNPDLYIMRARLHQLFRNTTLCYYDLKDALALDPEQQEAQTLMTELEGKAEQNRNHATRLQLQGKFKDSLTKITIAIEMNPSVSDYHLQRGALHRRLHDYNAAIDDFLLAMDKTEHNEHSGVYTDAQRQLLLTYNDFAVECFLGGHFEEAILLLNKALKGEKREKGLYINRGDCFFRLQELHFALADYHQASEIDPSDPGIRSRVAAIHSQFGLQDYVEHSYQDAEARFSVAIQHNARHGPYYIARCKVRLMMENQTGARQDFLMALHLDSSNTEILTLMPRIYPGKSVGDVMRTKHAKEAKIAADNAVMTASPIKLPGLDSCTMDGQQGAVGGADGGKRVTFAPSMAQEQDTVVPSLKYCMDEIEFNKILTKHKKKISNHVKSLLHDRSTTLPIEKPKLKPQPPPRPYELRGGHWKNPEPTIKPGWRTFSLGVGLMD